MAAVVVLKSAAIRGKAGRYISTAKGVTMLRTPSRRMMNQFDGRAIFDFVAFELNGMLKRLSF